MQFTKKDFGPEFKWGVSTAAYQIEGGWDTDGKGASIWDEFTTRKGKIANNEHGRTACDFYNRYTQDLAILQKLGIPNFRFSIAWSRILPEGIGRINQKGIDYYNRVINLCLELGIEPWITLYHWDLPLALEEKGGWTNREIINWFGEYVQLCVVSFGDRVKHWTVLSEPMAFTGAGYFLGLHAPGRKGLNSFMAAVHHAAMCQAEGGRIVRTLMPSARVGTSFSCSYVQPLGESDRNARAAIRVDALLNRLFAEPLAGLGYPTQDLKLLKHLEPFVKDGDESKLAFDMDFIGVQNYTRELVARSFFTPLIWAKLIKAEKRNVETTEMGWEIYPESIYEMLLKFGKYSAFKELIVSENGAAFQDHVFLGQVNDAQRKDFLESYLGQVLRAKRQGVNVTGYFVWSLTDNFEWAEGYKPRFGIVYVDFRTQERTIKESGYWFSSLVKG